MNIEVLEISPTRKTLKVSLEAAEVSTEHKNVVAAFSQQARIPGFRPGKAPANMVARRFAKEIDGEFKQKVLAKAYRDGLEAQKLDVMNLVTVDEGTIEADAPVEVSFTLDIRPSFELPNYEGLPTEIVPVETTEEEVEKAIEAMRAERADFKVKTEASAKGDYVKLAYEGSIDGTPILELAPEKQIYGKVPQTWEEVEGENEGIIPGLGKALAGVVVGDKKTVKIQFPADFSAVEALAGKEADYAIEVLEVRERVLPEIDDEFLKAAQADDLESLKSGIKGNLQGRKEQENRSKQRQQVTEALLTAVDFEAPASLVENETQGVLRNFIEENMRRGVPQEQFEKDKEALHANATQAATSRVRSQLILAAIAEKEEIKVTEQDINVFIYREAMRTRQAPDKLAKELGKDRDRLRSIQQSIIFDKALDLVVSKATVTNAAPQA